MMKTGTDNMIDLPGLHFCSELSKKQNSNRHKGCLYMSFCDDFSEVMSNYSVAIYLQGCRKG